MKKIAYNALTILGHRLDFMRRIADEEVRLHHMDSIRDEMRRIHNRFCKIHFEVYDGHGGSIRTGLTLN